MTMAINNYLKHFLLRNVHQFISRRSYTEVVSVVNEIRENKPKLEKEPFMKNIFLGKVDTDILVFPEVDSSEELPLIRDKPLQLQTKAIVSEENDFSQLLRSGICGMTLPKEYGGKSINSTTFLRELEKFDISPVTSFLLEIQCSLIIDSLVKYGSEMQKKKYLNDLISGTITGAYALHEDMAGSDPPSIQCTATQSEFSEESSYILNGEKSWITNANSSKFFIVFAQCEETNRPIANKLLTAFIVERDTPGITITKQENKSKGFDVYRVKFDNVSVPFNSILKTVGSGYEIATSNLESSKFILATSVLNLIRKLISQVTTRVCQTSRFPVSMKDYELVQYKLAKIATILYALESSVYFLGGMNDLYIMDTSMESVIVQNLIHFYGINAFNECINIAGLHALDIESTFVDLPLLLRSFTTPIIFKLYIALKGLEFVGINLSDTVTKLRNPFNFPGFIFKRMLESRRQANDSPKLDKNLYMEFHPSLKLSVDQLEYCINRLQYSVETLFVHHGAATVERQIDLVRLSDIATDIFSMIAVLTRASRAYCTGIQHYDQEVFVAKSWCQLTMKNIKTKVTRIVEEKVTYSDQVFLKLAPNILQNKGYFFVNPMEKNIN